MLAERIFGDAAEERFRGRRRHYVDVGWGDAGKHRQRVVADTGVEVRIMMPRGTFLRDGAVIADDGTQIVVVRRPPEPAVTVRFADHADAAGARRMLLLGYLLGNQHALFAAPLQPDQCFTIVVPLHIVQSKFRRHGFRRKRASPGSILLQTLDHLTYSCEDSRGDKETPRSHGASGFGMECGKKFFMKN